MMGDLQYPKFSYYTELIGVIWEKKQKKKEKNKTPT